MTGEVKSHHGQGWILYNFLFLSGRWSGRSTEGEVEIKITFGYTIMKYVIALSLDKMKVKSYNYKGSFDLVLERDLITIISFIVHFHVPKKTKSSKTIFPC